MGYFCVDNLPISLISKFAEMAYTPGSEIQRVAAWHGCKKRRGTWKTGRCAGRHGGSQSEIRDPVYGCSQMKTLVKRYKETRRTPSAGTRTAGWTDGICTGRTGEAGVSEE